MNSATSRALLPTAIPAARTLTSSWLGAALLVVAGSALLTVSAKVQVPMWPVPMTMQSFVVLFLGALLGPRLGAAAVATYLAQGFAGLPVFALPGAGGPAYFLGATGGFLLSFIPAAWIAGRCAHAGAPLWKVAAGMTAAHALILIVGMLWLAFLAQLASGAVGVGLSRAYAAGVAPFIVGSVVKTALAVAFVAAGFRLAQTSR
jgi:biotin transport system substrate-specific component